MQQWMCSDMKLNIPDITNKHWILIDIICSFTTHWSVNLPHMRPACIHVHVLPCNLYQTLILCHHVYTLQLYITYACNYVLNYRWLYQRSLAVTMAEAHSAVAFTFSVTHEGVNVDVNHEALKAVFKSGLRSIKKSMGRIKVL